MSDRLLRTSLPSPNHEYKSLYNEFCGLRGVPLLLPAGVCLVLQSTHPYWSRSGPGQR
eukprot:jgi/Botrbrau1/2207/Bobra.101_2s0037.1